MDKTISLSEYDKKYLIEAVANNYRDLGDTDRYNNHEWTPPWRWGTKWRYIYDSYYRRWGNVYMELNTLSECYVSSKYVLKFLHAKGVSNPEHVIKALGNDTAEFVRDGKVITFFIHKVETTNNPRGFLHSCITKGFDYSQFDLSRFHELEIQLAELISQLEDQLKACGFSREKIIKEENAFVHGIINTCYPGRVVYKDPTNRALKHIHPVFKGDGLNITDSDKKLLLEYIANNVYILSEGPQWEHKRYTIAESFVDYDDLVKYLTKNWTLKHAGNVIKHTIGEDSLLIGADEQGVVFYKKIIFYVKYDNKTF